MWVGEPRAEATYVPGDHNSSGPAESQYLIEVLAEITRTVNDLRNGLDEVLALIQDASVATANEIELGDLFMKAQTFIEGAMADLQARGSAILNEACTIADAILADSIRRADEILRASAAGYAPPGPPQAASNYYSSAYRDVMSRIDNLRSSFRPSAPPDTPR